eukprot:CAMPEP_0203715822 /NCGR_PEP_ID=MMETSP0092-20131115/575_1 /ASSEMBLY_ACC=CAM_ASM_001090 /TAXON_ID=426623 /ORGANISM="Chaetoceros affinis, Strain CCMP159" /LENGTH=64 /DNA_ID=CAMNT_0050594129 /DNA_START=5 /DNA_END=196 /DNA_ORIENTATION=+
MRVAPAAPTAIDTKPPTALPMIRLDAALSSAGDREIATEIDHFPDPPQYDGQQPQQGHYDLLRR